jgi:hypothetical protein
LEGSRFQTAQAGSAFRRRPSSCYIELGCALGGRINSGNDSLQFGVSPHEETDGYGMGGYSGYITD